MLASSSLDDVCQSTTCGQCGYSSTVADRSPQAAPMKGVEIGRFQLISLIGKGSFGAVWKAHDPHLDRYVAIKLPRRTELDAVEAELFLREARTAAQIQHSNVVRVHEVGRDGDQIFLVCDLIPGESLSARCKRKPLSINDSVAIVRSMATALHHVHECGVIHRDLKPSNILLDVEGKPYLSDFGLARRIHGDVTLTVDGQLIGTPAYMSPEQAKGDAREVNESSDIYSLGVVLFELLTGVVPFQGGVHSMVEQAINEQAPSPRKINAKVPRDLDTICLKCLEKRPEKRFASAAELAVDLDRFARNEPIHSRPISLMETTSRWVHRHPWMAALAATLLCLIVSGSQINRANIDRKNAEIDRHDAEMMAAVTESSVGTVIGGLIQPALELPRNRWVEWLYWVYDQWILHTQHDSTTYTLVNFTEI